MFALASKIIFCLLLAACLGFIVAWLLRGLRGKAMQDQLDSLQRNVSEKEHALQTMRTQTDIERNRVTDLETKLNGEQSRYTVLQGEMQTMQSAFQAEQAQVAQVKDQNAVYVNRIASFESDLSNLRSRMTHLSDEHAVQLNELKTQNEHYTNRIKALETDVSSAQVSLDGAKQEHTQFIHSLKSEHDSTLKAGLSTKDSRIQELEEQLSSARTELDQAQKEHNTKISALKTDHERHITSVLSDKDGRIKKLEADLVSANSSLDKANQDHSKNVSTLKSDHQAAVSSKDNRIKTLEDELASLRNKLTQTDKDHTVKISSLKSEHDSSMKTALAGKDSRITELMSQIGPLVGLPAALATSNKALEQEKTDHHADVTRLNEQINKLKGDLKMQHDQSQSTLAELRNAIDADKRSLAEFQSRTITLEADNKTQRQHIHELEGKIKQSDIAIDQVRGAYRSEQSQHITLMSQRDAAITQHTSRIAQLEQELRACGQQRKSLEEKLAASAAPTDAAVAPPRQFTNRPAQIDDLKHIYGVGPVLEKMLHDLGVYQFKQVAKWNDADVDYFDSKLQQFHGRIRREDWMRSAIEEHYKKYGQWLGDGNPEITKPETDRH